MKIIYKIKILYFRYICQASKENYYLLIGKSAKMANIRDVLARNLKENRQKLGITQAQLAERADISTNFVAMIELKHKFPAPETLDRLAAALGIETYKLFAVQTPPEDALERLHQAILGDLDLAIEKAVDKAIDKRIQNSKFTYKTAQH